MTGVLISAGPAGALWRDHASVSLDSGTIENALQSQGWHDAGSAGDWHPFYPEADARFLEEDDGGKPVSLFVGYYARPRAGRTVIAHLNRPWDDRFWNPSGGAEVGAKLGGTAIELNEYVISSGSSKRLVWFTYWADGSFTNKPLLVRLLQAKAALDGHDGQAVIALSTPLDVSLDEARSRLGNALTSLGPIPAALGKAQTENPKNQRAG